MVTTYYLQETIIPSLANVPIPMTYKVSGLSAPGYLELSQNAQYLENHTKTNRKSYLCCQLQPLMKYTDEM